MRAKAGITDIAMFLNVHLDGVKVTMVTEADEQGGFVVRYRMEDDKFVLVGDEAQMETVHGKVDISLVEDAPEWARKEYQQIRYVEAIKLTGISKCPT